ncbi:hypothetical protein KA005_33320, partial [bacterium]|nr:hypothetical protein [bacterium]
MVTILSLIFITSFTVTLFLASLFYRFLSGFLIHINTLITFPVFILGLICFYISFIMCLIIFYHIILKTILREGKEYSYFINDIPRKSYVKQELRIILDASIVALARPILFILPQFLRFLSCKLGKNLVLTGTVYNADIVEIGDNVIIGAGSLVTG